MFWFVSAKSVKAQICDVVYLLQLTIKQIVALFYTDETRNGKVLKNSQKSIFKGSSPNFTCTIKEI